MTEKIKNIIKELSNYHPEEGDSIQWLRHLISELNDEVNKSKKLYCYSKPNTMDGYLQNSDCHRYTDDVALCYADNIEQAIDIFSRLYDKSLLENNVKEVIKEPPKPIEMKNGIPVPPDIKNMNKKEKFYEFYVYVTRHGCYSETAVLHVGYQSASIHHGSYPTWYSEPVSKSQVDSIYDKVKRFDGEYTSDTSYVKELITYYIKETKK